MVVGKAAKEKGRVASTTKEQVIKWRANKIDNRKELHKIKK
jgi:hypothetical protein